MKILFIVVITLAAVSCSHFPLSDSKGGEKLPKKKPDFHSTNKGDTSTRIVVGKRLPSSIYLHFKTDSSDNVVNITSLGNKMIIFFIYGSKCVAYKSQIHSMDTLFNRISDDLVTITAREDGVKEYFPRNVPLYPFDFERSDGTRISVHDLFPQFNKNNTAPLIAFIDKGLIVHTVKQNNFKDVIKTIPQLKGR